MVTVATGPPGHSIAYDAEAGAFFLVPPVGEPRSVPSWFPLSAVTRAYGYTPTPEGRRVLNRTARLLR